jgi:hypothetical protein
MRKINCDECGKFLFETDKESNGAAGAQAQDKGFTYKNACLFSDKYSSLFFCDNVCSKSFYNKNIPKNAEMSKKIEGLKKDIPRMADETCKRMDRICTAFNGLKSKSKL